MLQLCPLFLEVMEELGKPPQTPGFGVLQLCWCKNMGVRVHQGTAGERTGQDSPEDARSPHSHLRQHRNPSFHRASTAVPATLLGSGSQNLRSPPSFPSRPLRLYSSPRIHPRRRPRGRAPGFAARGLLGQVLAGSGRSQPRYAPGRDPGILPSWMKNQVCAQLVFWRTARKLPIFLRFPDHPSTRPQPPSRAEPAAKRETRSGGRRPFPVGQPPKKQPRFTLKPLRHEASSALTCPALIPAAAGSCRDSLLSRQRKKKNQNIPGPEKLEILRKNNKEQHSQLPWLSLEGTS